MQATPDTCKWQVWVKWWLQGKQVADFLTLYDDESDKNQFEPWVSVSQITTWKMSKNSHFEYCIYGPASFFSHSIFWNTEIKIEYNQKFLSDIFYVHEHDSFDLSQLNRTRMAGEFACQQVKIKKIHTGSKYYRLLNTRTYSIPIQFLESKTPA